MKKEEFRDLLTLLRIDKLSGDLRCSAKDQRKTTCTLDDFITAPNWELQALDHTNSKNTTHNWMRNDRLHSTKETSHGDFFLWNITLRQQLPKTPTLMIASR